MWSAQPTPSEEGATVVLSVGDAFRFGLLISVGLLLIGVLILVWRDRSPDKAAVSLVRSWIAVGLLFGLLMFCLMSFAMSDGGLRNTLTGGLTASVGAAIAFYFSAKSGERARQDMKDVMGAALGSVTVPDLAEKTFDQAMTAMATTPLRLAAEPSAPTAGHVVKSQDPVAGATAAPGSPVKAVFGEP